MSAREQILDVATRKMAEKGADATSLQAIAEEVGIRKPSILYHFENKNALRVAVLEDLLARWGEVMPKLFMATSRDGVARFEAIMAELVSFFTSDTDRARLLIREIMDHPEEMRTYLGRFVQPWLDVIADHIRKDQNAARSRSDVDPEAYVLTVVTMTLASLAMVEDMGSVLQANPTHKTSHERWAAEVVRIARVSLFKET